ncbi:hypothetical protein BT96DRAFT_638714 [Gymnopus androsaceus JB14]|uniref:Uncharacterized protein n=1 Tax=Gymnopus androsaceus JB14 TaxID=1447944 RepID=A0A6A4HSG4_9AGAR|nr:hypothetical protein BT96DRAFT_638714 [Gymnopus androsaceus JB14]
MTPLFTCFHTSTLFRLQPSLNHLIYRMIYLSPGNLYSSTMNSSSPAGIFLHEYPSAATTAPSNVANIGAGPQQLPKFFTMLLPLSCKSSIFSSESMFDFASPFDALSALGPGKKKPQPQIPSAISSSNADDSGSRTSVSTVDVKSTWRL